MSNPIVSFDEEAVKSELREPVRKTTEEAINAMFDEEADQLAGAAPYEHTDERGVPRRALRARVHHDVGPGHAQDAQAQGYALRHRGRRALQKARDQRRGGHHRDMPGRGVDAPHRGRQRDPVGRGRLRRHGRLDRRGVPEGQIPALHGAFLPQRPRQGPPNPSAPRTRPCSRPSTRWRRARHRRRRRSRWPPSSSR